MQSVVLTGIGSNKFKSALDAIHAIECSLSERAHIRDVVSWTPLVVQGWPAMKISNRYFSTGAAGLATDVVPFAEGVDPHGLLASIDREIYRHTLENEVGYFERESKENGSFK
jgi:hypothetical protein